MQHYFLTLMRDALTIEGKHPYAFFTTIYLHSTSGCYAFVLYLLAHQTTTAQHY